MLPTAPSTSPAWGKPRRCAERSSTRSGARPLPRDGREGGSSRGHSPRPPAEGAEKGEGEEERGGAAVLHGCHLRREERSRHPPTRPPPPALLGAPALLLGPPNNQPDPCPCPGRCRRQQCARKGGAAADRESWHPRGRPPAGRWGQQHAGLRDLKTYINFLAVKRKGPSPAALAVRPAFGGSTAKAPSLPVQEGRKGAADESGGRGHLPRPLRSCRCG